MTDVIKVDEPKEADVEDVIADLPAAKHRTMSGGSFVVPKGRRLSRMDSSSLSKQIDQADGFTIDKDELQSVIRNIDRKEGKLKRSKQMKWALGAAVAAMAIAMVCTFAVTFAAVETSKESHVKGDVMMGLNGKTVQTQQVHSFSQLYDLPEFDVTTLAEIKKLTVNFVDGMSGSYVVNEVSKERGSRTVTFSVGNGNEIVVDGDSKLAVATINGKKRVVDTSGGKKRQLSARNTPARLYEASEFFTKSRGFVRDGSRKLAADNDIGGYAVVGLAAAEAVLESFNKVHDPSAKSVLLSGSMIGAKTYKAEVYWDKEKKKRKVVMYANDPITGKALRHVTDMTLGAGFTFTYQCDKLGGCTDNAHWTATKCEHLELTSDEYQAKVEAVQAEVTQHSGDAFVVMAATGEYFEGTAKFGADATEIFVPTADECTALNKPEGAGTGVDPDAGLTQVEKDNALKETMADPESHGGRRLWNGGSASNKDLWLTAQCSYKDTNAPRHWRKWVLCETLGSRAQFVYKYPTMVLSFAGTSGLTAFGDWKDNLNTNINQHKHTNIRTHQGFFNYQNRVLPCINRHVKLLAGWGIAIDYVTGHSLGGAAATVYTQTSGNSLPKKGTYTFGAPATRNNNKCSVRGKRFAHQKDAVASNGMGLLSSFNHDISSSTQVYDQSYCGSNCGWFGCCAWGWRSRPKTRHQDCAAKSGGCSWLLDCGYYFATVHGKYGNYL